MFLLVNLVHKITNERGTRNVFAKLFFGESITSIDYLLIIIWNFLTAFSQSWGPSDSSQSVFGQQNNSSNNLFAPKSFGSPTPFRSETGISMSGGTSTGVFGAPQTPSLFSSNTTLGASSSPAFGGSSLPAFGASSTPAFGSSMPAFRESSTPVLGNLSSSSFGGRFSIGNFDIFPFY